MNSSRSSSSSSSSERRNYGAPVASGSRQLVATILVTAIVTLAATQLRFVGAQRQSAAAAADDGGFHSSNHEEREVISVHPYEGFEPPPNSNLSFNVIEHKRYVESVSSRCMASTLMEDPRSLEPSFVLVKPLGETRLPATVEPLSRILAAGYEPQKPTVILIHGFTQSYPETKWLRRARALFEQHQRVGAFNLIIMDWSPASGGSYSQAAAMASGMGSFLANFMSKLFELGAERHTMHVIGHSLGAHVAGFAGKRTRPRFGRITALDPAGPCFGKILSNSPTDRLSPDDAIEVDVYHYDDDFLGLPGQHGQFDVYVNGGSKQPGCSGNMNSMMQAMVTMIFRRNRALSESHTRSTEVAVAPLSQNGCQLVAYECRDYAAFTRGECAHCDHLNGQCFLMSFDFQYGLQEDPISLLKRSFQLHQRRQQQAAALTPPLRTSFPGKRLYITTGSSEIYCLQHYQVLVKLEPTAELAAQAKRQRWRLLLDAASDDPQQPRINITLSNQVAPNVFSYLLLSEQRPARIRAARLQLRSGHSNGLIPLSSPSGGAGATQQQANNSPSGAKQQALPVQAFAIEVQFMSSIDPQVRRMLSSRLCPTSDELQANSIPDSSSAAAAAEAAASSQPDDEWLHFEECF